MAYGIVVMLSRRDDPFVGLLSPTEYPSVADLQRTIGIAAFGRGGICAS